MTLLPAVSRLALCAVLVGGGAVACGGDDDGGGSASGFCDKVQELEDFEFDFEAEDTAAQEEEFQNLVDEAVDAAPGEIQEDLELVTSEDADPESEEYKDAEERISTYVEDECGISIEDGEE